MDSLSKMYDDLMSIYHDIKREVRRRDKHLYERWKAGGFLVDDDILSMYPDLGKVVEQLGDEDDEDDEDDETAENPEET